MAGKYEIDKEEMFRKIMPSAGQNNPQAGDGQADESTGGTMSEDTISGGPMSEDAIAAAFAAAQGAEPEPAPQPEPAAPAGGPMSEDAIAAAFAAAQGAEPEPAPQPELTEEPEPARGNGFMSADAIAAAFAAANGEAAPQPTGATTNGNMSDDAIAAAFAATQNGDQPASPPAEMTADDFSGGSMSEDAIAAAFAAQEPASVPQPEPAPMPYSEPAAAEPAEVSYSEPDVAEPFATYDEPLAAEPEPAATPVQPGFHISSTPQGSSLPYPINLMELLVDRYYPIYRERLKGCTCQRCKDDVSGITLNKITPHYVTSEQLPEVEPANREMVTETVTALIKALYIVKRNPHHDEQAVMRQ